MTSTRSTIPAPPPNGVSSTAPPLRVVVARGSTHSSVCPSARALVTCRWPRYQSNHCGNSVKTSASIDESEVDVDPAALDVHGADRVAHQGDQAVPDLQRLARRQGEHPLHHPDLGLAVHHEAALEVARPELALLERRRLGER